MGAQTKYLAEWYRYYGGLADKVEGAVIPSDKPGIFNFTRYEPLGSDLLKSLNGKPFAWEKSKSGTMAN